MARPQKQIVDYFPHMCNHGKTIFVLEQQYQAKGYAFWFKLLEELGRTNGHCLDLSDVSTLEFLAAKTWFTTTETLEVLGLLSRLGAIDKKLWAEKKVWSQNFVENLSPVYSKRVVSTPEMPVSAPETPVSSDGNPQSKVNYSKLKESKLNIDIAASNESAEAVSNIQEIMNIFYRINPTLNFGNKTQRKAIVELLGRLTFEKTKKLAEYAISVQGQPFSPTITTPYQLKEKVSALVAYHQKQENQKPKGVTIAGL